MFPNLVCWRRQDMERESDDLQLKALRIPKEESSNLVTIVIKINKS